MNPTNNYPRCKNLGIRFDPDTFFQYVSDSNYCHRVNPAKPVMQAHQTEYCLSSNHVKCPLYDEAWNGVMPPNQQILDGPRSSPGVFSRRGRNFGYGRDNSRLYWYLGGALVIVFLAVMWFLGSNSGSNNDNNRDSQNAGVDGSQSTLAVTTEPTGTPELPTATEIPNTEVPTETPEPTNTLVPTETPLPTNTPFPTPGPGFETPFGPDGRFVIHVVLAGESYLAIAGRYNTTPEILQAINLSPEGLSLWAGRQLVVPIGATLRGDLPIFDIVFTDSSVNINNLADFYNSDSEGIRFYNQLGESDIVPSGRWLIIPIVEG